MTIYRGYILDGACFHSKEEIDSFIRNRAIRDMQDAHKTAISTSDAELAMIASGIAYERSMFLVWECGMTPEEVEALEVA